MLKDSLQFNGTTFPICIIKALAPTFVHVETKSPLTVEFARTYCCCWFFIFHTPRYSWILYL